MKKSLLIIVITCIIIFNISLWADYTININPNNKEYADLLFKWYDYYQDEDFETAVYYYEQARDICSDSYDCDVAENLLVSAYYKLANDAYEADDTRSTIKRYKKLLAISPNEFSALVNIWIAYIWEDPETALSYLKKARRYAEDPEDIELVENNIKSVENILENFEQLKEEKELKTLNKTNDEFVHKQFYLYYLNVFDAREKIPVNDNTITVAIIDDWIKYNHPDLKNSIWTNNWEEIWNWIDDDGNWYIDDYFWWNFVNKSNDITPSWSHWTMIAWIIWATSNNNSWIAWIIPNWRVKLMPLITFWDDWKATDKNIISAINYAVDNWADIINLSLWWELNEYSDAYNDIIQKANDKWVIIVAAAGNWDETKDPKIWINTTNDLLSPVCNGDYKYSVIWVWATDKDWNIASWSNYWNCVDVYTYWESIFSTSNTWESLYAVWTWTSFSTPMVAGILWLWKLKYWNVWLSDVYSAIKWSSNGNTLDAVKYLDNLSKFSSETQPKNTTTKTTDSVSLWWTNNWSTQNNVKNDASDLEIAIQWMYDNWLTIYNTPKTFMSNNYLTREQASKFFVQFATTVLNKDKWNIKSYNIYSDIYNANPTLKDYIIYASNMWLFKWSNGRFMPFSNLTQAQALAVTIRLLDWYLEEPKDSWYIYYFYRAQMYWILWKTGIKFTSADRFYITRWDMALILYNAYKYYNNIK